MSIDGPNPNDILAAMEAQLADCSEPDDVTSVKDIPAPELAGRLKEVEGELSRLGELLEKGPGSERGRQLHSERNALLIEMRHRGLR